MSGRVTLNLHDSVYYGLYINGLGVVYLSKDIIYIVNRLYQTSHTNILTLR